MNLFIVDLETTGLDSSKHEIIEIGCVNTSNGETFECKVHPLHLSDADPKALEINGYKHEDWEDAFLLPNALKLLGQFVTCGEEKSSPHFMSYNASFDWPFLQQAYARTGIRDPFHYHHLCLLTLAWNWQGKPESLSLKNVSLALGIPPEPEVHRAINGALTAYKVFKFLTYKNN